MYENESGMESLKIKYETSSVGLLCGSYTVKRQKEKKRELITEDSDS